MAGESPWQCHFCPKWSLACWRINFYHRWFISSQGCSFDLIQFRYLLLRWSVFAHHSFLLQTCCLLSEFKSSDSCPLQTDRCWSVWMWWEVSTIFPVSYFIEWLFGCFSKKCIISVYQRRCSVLHLHQLALCFVFFTHHQLPKPARLSRTEEQRCRAMKEKVEKLFFPLCIVLLLTETVIGPCVCGSGIRGRMRYH